MKLNIVKTIGAFWLLMGIASIAFWCAVIYGIVKLVGSL